MFKKRKEKNCVCFPSDDWNTFTSTPIVNFGPRLKVNPEIESKPRNWLSAAASVRLPRAKTSERRRAAPPVSNPQMRKRGSLSGPSPSPRRDNWSGSHGSLWPPAPTSDLSLTLEVMDPCDPYPHLWPFFGSGSHGSMWPLPPPLTFLWLWKSWIHVTPAPTSDLSLALETSEKQEVCDWVRCKLQARVSFLRRQARVSDILPPTPSTSLQHPAPTPSTSLRHPSSNTKHQFTASFFQALP